MLDDPSPEYSTERDVRWLRVTEDNFDRILASLQYLDLADGVTFSGGDTQYNSGEPANARQYIIEEFGWEIFGGVAE